MIALMKKLIYLIAVITVISSCKEDKSIGLNLQDDDQLIGTTFIDTFTVSLSTTIDRKEIRTNNTNRLLIGHYTDDFLGEVTANAFLATTTNQGIIENNPICDSVILRLIYFEERTDEFYYHGDTINPLVFSVFEIVEDFNEDSIYTSSSSLPFSSTTIGSFNQPPSPQSGELNTALDVAYGQALIDAINSNQFEEMHHGITIQGDETSSILMGFNPATTATKIEVHYHTSSDTSSFDILLNERRFHQVVADRSLTSLASINNEGDAVNATNSGNRSFIQSGVGLNTVVSIPGLEAFLQNNPTIIINKATLSLHVDPTTTGSNTTEAPRTVIMAQADKNNFLVRNNNEELEIIRNDSISIGIGGSDFGYNSSELTYELPISFHLQKIASGKINYNSFAILSNELNSVRSAVILNNTAPIEQQPKLKLYYTK